MLVVAFFTRIVSTGIVFLPFLHHNICFPHVTSFFLVESIRVSRVESSQSWKSFGFATRDCGCLRYLKITSLLYCSRTARTTTNSYRNLPYLELSTVRNEQTNKQTKHKMRRGTITSTLFYFTVHTSSYIIHILQYCTVHYHFRTNEKEKEIKIEKKNWIHILHTVHKCPRSLQVLYCMLYSFFFKFICNNYYIFTFVHSLIHWFI